MSKPVLIRRLAKWALLFNQYEIIYIPAKAVKGQALTYFLAGCLIQFHMTCQMKKCSMPMFFDRSTGLDEAEVGVVFVSPQKLVLPYSFCLKELCSNNVAEYQSLIIELVINQLLIEYEVRKDDLVPYYRLATQFLQRSDAVIVEHVPRKENQMADTLANLASNIALREGEDVNILICQRWVVLLIIESPLEDANIISILPIDTEEWRQLLINYLEHEKLPDNPRHRLDVQ
ncbi:uncharacterized protein [Malus domestica]|uniref:uncharacterized protein n=1 Tax=Malus domestica TaxID=3750 RepID=UPI003974B3E8